MVYPTLKLSYFDSEGLAEAIRLAFFIADIPFVDERFTWEQFPAIKPSLPYGTLPTLEVDGLVLAEAEAIGRFAGRLTKTYPVNDPVAALAVDELFCGLNQFAESFKAIHFEKDDAKKPELVRSLVAVTIPRHLSLIDARLAQMQRLPGLGDPSKVYLHELWVRGFMRTMFRSGFMSFVPSDLVDSYPNWMAIEKKVEEHPKVQQWNAMSHGQQVTLKLLDVVGNQSANTIRLVLQLGNISFEDERMEKEKLETVKTAFPYEQLPALDIDGQVLGQPAAILRYAGTVAGLYPANDPMWAMKIDELLGQLEEVYNAYAAVCTEEDDAKKSLMSAAFVKETAPKILGNVEKRLAIWGGPFATGDKLSLADVRIHTLVSDLLGNAASGVSADALESYQQLMSVHAIVQKDPRVQDWYAKQQC